MKNTINFNRQVGDFPEFIDGGKITIASNVDDLFFCNKKNEVMDGFIFDITIENEDYSCPYKFMNIGVPINELELFAKSIITHIEIIRGTYGEQIKQQHDKGNII
jgi:hypothetical protein